MKLNILIVYADPDYPLKSTIRDLLYCFRNESNHNVFYFDAVNTVFNPNHFEQIKFDLVIFHKLFIHGRFKGFKNEQFKQKHLINTAWLKGFDTVKIVMTQDEWYGSDFICKFIDDYNISKVFTVAPQSEWNKIFGKVKNKSVEYIEVLTGYFDQTIINMVEEKKKLQRKRRTDVGYRAFKNPPMLGRFGFLKTQIADTFNEFLKNKNLIIDISTQSKDTIYGDKWYDFLLDCRFQLGVEGGATVQDNDGAIWFKGNDYIAKHPDASFEQIEEACFKGKDGKFDLKALSPRHLEACLTETCQVLIEGHYNGILKPDVHYIPVKPDFSNLEEVFSKMQNTELTKYLVANAYNDIVLSNKYTYKAFVQLVLTKSNVLTLKKDGVPINLIDHFIFSLNDYLSRAWWKYRNSGEHSVITIFLIGLKKLKLVNI